MTVAFVDTPGSTLPSLSEPLDFTATLDVISISVSFGDRRPEERVYRDGVFVWPYLRSTNVASAYSIVRDDGTFAGWPAPPTLYVDEEPPPPPDVPKAWGTLYDVDLTALPTQSAGAPGAHIIDGLTWYLKGALSGLAGSQVMTAGVVNASGLRLATTVAGAPAAVAIGTSAILPQASWWLPFSQIPNFRADAPVLAQFRLVNTVGASSTYPRPMAGLSSCADDATAVQAAERANEHLAGPHSSGGSTNNVRYKTGTGTATNVGVTGLPGYSPGATAALECRVWALPWTSVLQYDAWLGAFTALTSGYMNTLTMLSLQRTRANPGLLFVFENQNIVARGELTHLRISQPGAA